MQTSAYLLWSSMFVSGVGGGVSDGRVSPAPGTSSAVHYSPGAGAGYDYGPGTTPGSTSDPEEPGYTEMYECDEAAAWTGDLEEDCVDGDDTACEELSDAYATYAAICGHEYDDYEDRMPEECDEIDEWIIDLEDDCDGGDDGACDDLTEAYDAACGDTPTDLGECTVEDVEEKELECECDSKREAHDFVVKTFNSNIRELRTMIALLDDARRRLDRAEHELLGTTDKYVAKIAGRCALAGIEGAVVGKGINLTRAACADGVFGAQCLAAGFTVKEVTKYVATSNAAKASVHALLSGTLKITAEVAKDEDTGWIRFIPVVGEWCSANKWSKKVFSAPDLIREIGNQKIRVMRKKHELLGDIRRIEEMIREANDNLREEGCSDVGPMVP